MSSLVRHIPSLSLHLAMQVLQAVLSEAQKQQVAVSIAVVGPTGELIHMAHMDGAAFLSRDIAHNKALSAVNFKTSTASWQTRLPLCSTAVQQGLPLQTGMALFGGGEPLLHDGQLLGAVGVSGASEALDVQCAQAGAARLQCLLQGAG